jgi:SAM-dependent methyltransferase
VRKDPSDIPVSQDDIVFKWGREKLPSNSVAKRGIREYYDRFYAKADFEYYTEQITGKFLRAILRKAGVREHSFILDVGCATGFYTEQFRLMGHSAVGLDISRVGIMKGHVKYPDLPLLVADAALMPFKPSSFDVLFMLGCSLTNTYDLRAIQEYVSYLTNYLKRNGVLIFMGGSNFLGGTSPSSEWIYHRYDEIMRFVDRDKVDASVPYVTFFKLTSTFGKFSLNKSLSFALRALPLKKPRNIIYFIRKKNN